MRKLIAGMKISADGKIEGPEGYADWVEAWSDDYDVMPRVDACLLGAGMYPGYEQYWTAIQNEPDQPNCRRPARCRHRTRSPTPSFAAQTPHYVLSSTLASVQVAEDQQRAGTRRSRGAQAAARQGHLSRRRRSNHREPYRCRVGGRAPADRLPPHRRYGQGSFRGDGTTTSTRTTARRAASRRPRQPDLRNPLTCRGLPRAAEDGGAPGARYSAG